MTPHPSDPRSWDHSVRLRWRMQEVVGCWAATTHGLDAGAEGTLLAAYLRPINVQKKNFTCRWEVLRDVHHTGIADILAAPQVDLKPLHTFRQTFGKRNNAGIIYELAIAKLQGYTCESRW